MQKKKIKKLLTKRGKQKNYKTWHKNQDLSTQKNYYNYVKKKHNYYIESEEKKLFITYYIIIIINSRGKERERKE